MLYYFVEQRAHPYHALEHQSSSLAQKLVDAGFPNVWGWDTRCAGTAAQVLAVNFFQLKNVKDNFITKNRSCYSTCIILIINKKLIYLNML